MAKMIEVHLESKPLFLNLDCVTVISGKSNAVIFGNGLDGDGFRIDESYDEIRSLIAKAQGGIPIGKGYL